MQIIIENGSYGMQNFGDVSMLQSAVARLRHLWPDANLQVVTERPDRLLAACPDVEPFPIRGYWSHALWKVAPGIEKSLGNRHLQLAMIGMKAAAKLRHHDLNIRDESAIRARIAQADMVVASGGGYLNDSFEYYASPILRNLELAVEMGKRTALFGQGIGPIGDGALREQACTILPKIDLIAVREQRVGPALLESFGVKPERIFVTGDDAVEVAYDLRSSTSGTAIGINLRRKSYASVDDVVVSRVREALRQMMSKYNAPAVPVPISMSKNEKDDETIRLILTGVDDASDGGRELRSVKQLFEHINRCRVILTGSYHAAVFGLSCGIPVVCVAGSEYYVDKFAGLADMFGSDCHVVLLNNTDQDTQRIVEPLELAWQTADVARPRLLLTAQRQIQASRDAYKNVFNLLHA